MFFLLFLSLSQKIGLTGEWNDTPPSAEAIAFFEDLHPELLPKIESIINNQNFNIKDIISKLNNHVKPEILSLINLTLHLKYYHPAAVASGQTTQEKAKFTTWGVELQDQENQVSLNDISFSRAIAKILDNSSSTERIHRFEMMVNDLKSNFFSGSLDSKLYQLQNRIKSIGNKQHVSVNGRETEIDIMDITSSIIAEYKTNKILEGLNITERKFLTQSPAKKIYHHSGILDKGPKLEPHDITKQRGRWNARLIKNSQYLQFLRNKEPIVVIQMFFRIGSPMIQPLMDYASRMARSTKPFTFNFFLIGDPKNATEYLDVAAFWQVCDNVGARNGATYLVDYAKMGAKKAYKRTLSDIKWRKRSKFLSNENIKRRARAAFDFANKHGIGDWAVSINGEFIEDDVPLETINQRILLTSRRVQEGMEAAETIEPKEISNWYRESALQIDTAFPPLKLGAQNRISLDDKSPKEIIDALKEIHSFKPYKNGKNPQIPIFFVDKKPEFLGDVDDVSLFSIPAPESKIFKNVKTIVGPFIFEKELSEKEVRYAINYTRYAYNIGRTSVPLIESHFILMWKSYHQFIQSNRVNPPNHPQDICTITRNSDLMVYITTTPNSPSIWPILQLVKLLDQCTAVGVSLVLSPNVKQLEGLGGIERSRFIPAFNTTEVEIPDGVNYRIMRPRFWMMKVDKMQKHSIQGIVVHGFADSAEVKIGEEYRKTRKDGYFAMVLPAGSLSCSGLPFDTFYVKTAAPVFSFYRGKTGVVKQTEGHEEAIYSFMWQPNPQIMKSMLYTLYSNISIDIQHYIIDPYMALHPHNDTTYLPLFVPHNCPQPKSILWFVKISKYLYPGTMIPSRVRTLVFADESMVFRGDVARLIRLEPRTFAMAAPIASDSDEGKPWGTWEMRTARMGRPYHTAALIVFDVRQWVKQRGSEMYLDIHRLNTDSQSTIGYGDDEYMNMLQLRVQTLSLPPTTAFCAENQPQRNSRKAFAHVRCCAKSDKLYGTRPKKLLEDANSFFENL